MSLFKILVPAVLFTNNVFGQQNKTTATQKTFRNEISLVTENDNYVLWRRDGYYTNGFYLTLSRAADIANSKWFKNKPGIKKVVNGFQISQAIYNPVSYNRPLPEQQDRPFAGYLSANFCQHIFYQNNSVLEWAAALGTIGPNSAAKNVQRWYHSVICIYDVFGWPYQVKNEFRLKIKAAYYRNLLKLQPRHSKVNIDGFSRANVGNAFTDFTIGTTLKLGLVENHYNSSHWWARISTATGAKPVRHHELYFFYEPAVTLQVYNAVLQGGMFVKDKGPVTVRYRAGNFSAASRHTLCTKAGYGCRCIY